jgi:hypothetical protein
MSGRFARGGFRRREIVPEPPQAFIRTLDLPWASTTVREMTEEAATARSRGAALDISKYHVRVHAVPTARNAAAATAASLASFHSRHALMAEFGTSALVDRPNYAHPYISPADGSFTGGPGVSPIYSAFEHTYESSSREVNQQYPAWTSTESWQRAGYEEEYRDDGDDGHGGGEYAGEEGESEEESEEEDSSTDGPTSVPVVVSSTDIAEQLAREISAMGDFGVSDSDWVQCEFPGCGDPAEVSCEQCVEGCHAGLFMCAMHDWVNHSSINAAFHARRCRSKVNTPAVLGPNEFLLPTGACNRGTCAALCWPAHT